MVAILNSAMLDSDTAILDSDTLLSSLRFIQKHSTLAILTLVLQLFAQKTSNSFILFLTWWWQLFLTLPSWIFSSLGFSHQSFSSHTHLHSGSRLMMAAILHKNSSILNSVILDSAIFVFHFKLSLTLCHDWIPIHLAQKNLHSFILTQFDDGSHLEFLPCWIQTLPSWIQTLFYLLSDLLKNTLSPLWLWFKLIQSDSNSFILT